MKILLALHVFFPESSAGTEVLTLETAKALRLAGHDVRIFTGALKNRAGAEDQESWSDEYDGFPVERFCPGSNATEKDKNYVESTYYSRAAKELLGRYLRAHQPDVVHFFHLHQLSASVIDACVELRIPTVLTPTDFWMVCPMGQLLLPDYSLCAGPDVNGVNCFKHMARAYGPTRGFRILKILPDKAIASFISMIDRDAQNKSIRMQNLAALYRRPQFLKGVVQRINRILPPTQRILKMLNDLDVSVARINFSPYGLNLRPFLAQGQVVEARVPTIAFIGSLTQAKGPHVLLRAVAQLPRDKAIKLKVYGHLGKNKYARQLQKIADSDPRIELCGTFQNQKIGEVFAAVDALCIPSIWYENMPLVLLSAMAAKVPVIASDLPGLSEVVRHGENGLLFEPGNSKKLNEVLLDITNRPHKLLELANGTQPPRSIESYAQELGQVYEDLIHAKT